MGDKLFYNPERKQEYLDSIPYPATREMNKYLFKKTKKEEMKLGKDICEMNKDEIKSVLMSLGTPSIDSAYNYLFKLEYYIDWAVKYRKTSINALTVIPKKREWAAQCVSTYKQSLFTREEILKMCNELKNYPDRAVLLGLFEGISGEGYSDLLNLKLSDIKEVEGKYIVTLYDKMEIPRELEISDKLAHYLELTDRETTYYNKNGLSDSLRSAESVLTPSPYIFKKSARGRQTGGLDLFFVHRKFSMFKELFEANELTPKEVINSGMMHMVNEIHQAQGFMTNEDWLKIAEHYNTSFVLYNGVSVRNTLSIRKKAFEKKFEDIYGYQVIEKVLTK